MYLDNLNSYHFLSSLMMLSKIICLICFVTFSFLLCFFVPFAHLFLYMLSTKAFLLKATNLKMNFFPFPLKFISNFHSPINFIVCLTTKFIYSLNPGSVDFHTSLIPPNALNSHIVTVAIFCWNEVQDMYYFYKLWVNIKISRLTIILFTRFVLHYGEDLNIWCINHCYQTPLPVCIFCYCLWSIDSTLCQIVPLTLHHTSK